MTSILNSNIDALRSATGTKIAMWFMLLTQAVAGVIIAFVYSWKLTLGAGCLGCYDATTHILTSPTVLLAISPLMALGGVLQMRILASSSQKQNEAFEEATNLAVECLAAMGTVVSFGWEPEAKQRYFASIQKTVKPRVTGVHLAALAWAVSFFFIFAWYRVCGARAHTHMHLTMHP